MSYEDDPDVAAFSITKPKYSVDEVKKMIYGQESNFGKVNTAKPNYAGAYGPMQITEPTFNGLKKQGLIPANFDINNPEQSKKAAEILIEDLYKRHKGNADKVLAEYYAGPKAIKGDEINTTLRDLKNPKAPNVGEYIEQAKNKLNPYESDPDIMAFQPIKKTEKPVEKKSFVEEFKKPFETAGLEEFKKQSLLYNVSQLTNPFEAAEGAKHLAEKAGDLIKSISNVVQNPQETISAAYKEITENPGKFLGQTVKGIIYDPETLMPIGGVAKVSKPVTQQMAERGSVGAAGVTNKMTLQAAMDIASPELKKDLAEKFAKGETALLNEQALNAVLEADQLPVPIRLTEGQATQNPSLISRERNERGFKEQYVERFNEQNKLLGENATAIKEKVSPNVHTTDYVADAQELIDAINKKKQANKQATQEAYGALEKASDGKFPIDGKTFAENAINVLNKEDRFDYLPSTIQKKLNDYASGKKEMNFNLFENLRTDLAAEIRKAQRAGDGNQAYVLGQVRNELENLPLKGEAAQLKPLADKARSLAKADFELEANNLAYNKVVNDIADSKNFVEDLVIRSKNKDFANTLNLLSDNPQALEHLRSGTLDYIINKSKDASGNFATGQFNKFINNLDVNKKLFALFGEDAETIRNLAKTGQRIEARPKGSFVNESNTATALGSFAKQYAGKLFENLPGAKTITAPINIAKELIEERKTKKQIAESLKPAAGTKLKDIGKK